MTLAEKIDQEMTKALKAGERDRLTVLRGLKSDLKYKQIGTGKELPDNVALEVLSSAAKRRKESIEQFSKAGRDDLVKQEEFELGVISEFLPRQLTEDELKELVKEAITESGAETPQQIGLVMKVLMPKIKGRADGKLANRLISEILAK